MATRTRPPRKAASSAPKYTVEIESSDSEESETDIVEIHSDESLESASAASSPTPGGKSARKGSKKRGKSPAQNTANAQKKSPTKTTSTNKSPAKIDSPTKSTKKPKDIEPSTQTGKVSTSVDVVIPPALFAGTVNGDCTVLVQVEPHDALILDFEGASGAVGRFEADDEGVTLDLKGFRYSGIIHPGPTAMVVALGKGGNLKVEAITDEFVTLNKSQDVMAKLDAVVEGNLDGSYAVIDDDVNARERGGKKQQEDENAAEANGKLKAKKSSGKTKKGTTTPRKRKESATDSRNSAEKPGRRKKDGRTPTSKKTKGASE